MNCTMAIYHQAMLDLIKVDEDVLVSHLKMYKKCIKKNERIEQM